MKQTILKTLALGLMAMAGTNAWAGDFIDDATTISLTHSGGSKSTVTPNDGEKKTLSFTPTTTSDAIFEFEFTSKSVTPGQIFGVIEYTGNVQTGSNKCRFRNLTLDGNALEEGTAGSAAFGRCDGHQLDPPV